MVLENRCKIDMLKIRFLLMVAFIGNISQYLPIFLCVHGIILFNNCSLILEYIIGLKTGIGLGAGTDSLFSFTFISPFKKNVTFIVDGSQEGTLEAGKYVF